MRSLKIWIALVAAALLGLSGCGGGGGDPGTPLLGNGENNGEPVLSVVLSNSVVTGATPATVSAKVTDSGGNALPGVVVSFATQSGLGTVSAPTALTADNGVATVTLSPASAVTSGADTVVASATVSGASLSAEAGFQLTAASVEFDSFTADVGLTESTALSPYGQAILDIRMTGVSETAPVTLALTSACVTLGKASISPATVTSTSSNISVIYKDEGCGGSRDNDTITATIAGATDQAQLQLFLTIPEANSISFVSADPATIYLAGSGYIAASVVTFEVVDSADNPLTGQPVTLDLTTFTGGLTLDSGTAPVTKNTDGNGRVNVIINSGTVPTPVRVVASLSSGIQTVSSNLSVAVGLPSQLNFSFSQTTNNIEGWNIDGTTNQYTIRAADRSGNPVPDDTAVIFWAEGGQVQAEAKSLVIDGISKATASFESAEPRPADGRVTVVAYSLGEESFKDLNKNNVYDAGEPFQDMGDIVKDVLWDNVFDETVDESISLSGVAAGSSACTNFSATYPEFKLSSSIPSVPGTCTASWSGRTYVRRATQTVLSTSSARPLWGNTAGLDNNCSKITLQTGPYLSDFTVNNFTEVAGDTWYGGVAGSLSFLVGDANTYPIDYPGKAAALVGRLNPMAAGTVLTASATDGLTIRVAGGSPVPNSQEATYAVVAYEFDAGVTSGEVTVGFRSPSGLTTTVVVPVEVAGRPSACP
jgi:hypothetical protein